MNQIKDLIQYILDAVKIWVIIQPWQVGIRVRNGKKIKKLNKGIYFRLPYFDSIFVQENKLRVVSLPVQTLTSKDINTVTINGAVGYTITDIEKLYNTLFHPEITISNMAMSEAADFVFKNYLKNIDPHTIEAAVIKKLNNDDYGLTFEYFRLTNFAVVKTFRLIQDQSWVSEGLDMNYKK